MTTGPVTLAITGFGVLSGAGAGPAALAEALRSGHAAPADTVQSPAMAGHMFRTGLGAGWQLLGMAQVIPALTTGFGSAANDNVTQTELYATQPALMFNIESPRSRVVLRTTLNLEGLTQSDGELTFGAWGEGFIDRRHPHTLLHEAMLSVNVWEAAGGALNPALHPAAIARALADRAPGIATIDDVMEFLVAGAAAVQLGTVNFYNPGASMEVLDALPAALAAAGGSRVADVVGTLVADPVLKTRQGDKETGKQGEIEAKRS